MEWDDNTLTITMSKAVTSSAIKQLRAYQRRAVLRGVLKPCLIAILHNDSVCRIAPYLAKRTPCGDHPLARHSLNENVVNVSNCIFQSRVCICYRKTPWLGSSITGNHTIEEFHEYLSVLSYPTQLVRPDNDMMSDLPCSASCPCHGS